MQGLVVATLDRFVKHQFGESYHQHFKKQLQDATGIGAIVYHQSYPDTFVLKAVEIVCTDMDLQANDALFLFGKYFIVNELTGHLCAYLLQSVTSAKDLLLTMHDAHLQMRYASDTSKPPLFRYEYLPEVPDAIALIYAESRGLCTLLHGAIEGAAERYGEKAFVFEQYCQHTEADHCRFIVQFQKIQGNTQPVLEPQETERQAVLQRLSTTVLQALPIRKEDAIAIHDLSSLLQSYDIQRMRVTILYSLLQKLIAVGLVSYTTEIASNGSLCLRYWQAPRTWSRANAFLSTSASPSHKPTRSGKSLLPEAQSNKTASSDLLEGHLSADQLLHVLREQARITKKDFF